MARPRVMFSVSLMNPAWPREAHDSTARTRAAPRLRSTVFTSPRHFGGNSGTPMTNAAATDLSGKRRDFAGQRRARPLLPIGPFSRPRRSHASPP